MGKTFTANDRESFLYLFDRPGEPLVIPKGEKKVVFDLPEEYVLERYRPLTGDLTNRFGGAENRIVIDSTTALPDFSVPMQLGRRENFSLFIPYHHRLASALIEIFMDRRNREEFLAACAYCRDRLNPYLYIYALSVAILHRPDTRNIPIPSLAEMFPDKYVASSVFALATEEANIVPDGSRMPLEIPRDYTASDLDEEHRVAYFREDIGINLHHWHWHLVYPFDAPRNIVAKDRRGELFYYMHQQILARYNCERFSNNLARVKRLLNLREPIPEGYFPKLDSLVSSRVWPSRTANTILRDISRNVDQIRFDLQDLERWRDRIFEAIHIGRIRNVEGQEIQLTESRGIDILGNIMEASILSENRNLYGDLHNLGHVAIALSHDPDHRHLETFSVMGDPGTAMRDPAFYRWHAFIDDIFQEHKNTLPRYEVNQLDNPGVRVQSVEVNIAGQPKNLLATFWQQSDVDLSRGIDFSPRGPVFARFTHLQHAPFTYKIVVDNSGKATQGTVRIFLAPKFDERGLPFLLREQRLLFVELDKFTVQRSLHLGTYCDALHKCAGSSFNNEQRSRNPDSQEHSECNGLRKLKPKSNTITRSSGESSVTIPFERTFRNLEENRPAEGTDLEEFNFCGCGWPQHMLIPRGSPQGLPCQLFVMISNIQDDVVQTNPNLRGCTDAASYCGVRDSVYPDKRSMGYPFDRQPRNGVDTLQQFLTPNMAIQDVYIRFTDRIVPRTQPQATDKAAA